MRFCSLAFLLTQTLHVTSRIILLSEQHVRPSAPTFDFFEHKSAPYNVTGVACRVQLAKDPKTKLCKVVAPPALNKADLKQSFDETVLSVIFAEAYECGMSTISQLFDTTHEMQPLLARAGYPPSKTLVIFMDAVFEGDAGCPLALPYIAPKFSVTDAPPPHKLNVAMVSGNYAKEFLSMIDDSKPFAFNVVHETDPWNAVFTSHAYIAFNWLKFSTYFGAAAISLIVTMKKHKKRTPEMSLRTTVVWMAIVSAIIYTIIAPMRHHTYLRTQLEILGDFVATKAFLSLMYLWSDLFMQIRPRSNIYILRVLIMLGFLILTIFAANAILRTNQMSIPFVTEFIEEFSWYIVIPYQYVVTAVSVSFGVSFYRRRHTDHISPKTVASLNRLSLLAFMGLLFYGLVFAANYLFLDEYACEVPTYLLRTIIKELAFLLWITTLLLVLRIKSEQLKTSH